MKLLYTTTLLLFTFLLSAQYNYGLEVEAHDAKIEGKLDLVDGNNNIFVGRSSGVNNTTGFQNSFYGVRSGFTNTTGFSNNFFGLNSGFNNTSGTSNSFFGVSSGNRNTTGAVNSFFGSNSGNHNTTGGSNSFFGQDSGFYNETGYYNVAIGSGAGPSSNNTNQSHRLYIDVDLTFPFGGNDTPLIYGEFDNDLIRINGTFDVTGTATVKDTTTLENILQLKPLDTSMITPSTVCNSGQVFYGDDDEFYVCKAGSWKQIVTN